MTESAAEGRQRTRLVAGVCIGGPMLVTLIPMAAAPGMPAMAAHFAPGGGGELFAQMVMTLPAVMLIVSSPLAGLFAERFGRRLCLLLSLAIYVVGGAGVLLIDSRGPLIAFRLLLGVAGGGLLTSSLALIGEHFEDRARERVLGYATGASSFLAALALIFGGSLVDAFGWRAPFALYLLGIPVFAAAYVVIRHTGRTVHEPAKGPKRHASGLLAVSPLYLLLALLTIGMFTPAIQAPFLLQARGITTATLQGAMIAANSLVAMVSASCFGLVRRYLSVYAVLAVDALCMGAGITVMALVTDPVWFTVGCSVIGIGSGMSEPATASLIFDKTPTRVHALAMGLVVSALNLGQFINPLVIDTLRTAFGPIVPFLMLGGLLLAVGAGIALRAGATRRVTAIA